MADEKTDQEGGPPNVRKGPLKVTVGQYQEQVLREADKALRVRGDADRLHEDSSGHGDAEEELYERLEEAVLPPPERRGS